VTHRRTAATPIERTVRYATTVQEITDAWAFVMAWMDQCGPDPQIEIKPYWLVTDDDTERMFSVVVSGMQPIEEDQ
jgi:hypothetical protein